MGPHDYIPPRPSGTDAQARFMQWVWDVLTRWLRVKSTSTVKVSWGTSGISLQAARQKGGSAPAGVKTLSLVSISSSGQYMTCLDSSSATVYVLLPPTLRFVTGSVTYPGPVTVTYGSYDYTKQTRVASVAGGSGYSETQQITAPFVAGDIIIADPVDPVTLSGITISYQAQAAGRFWAKMDTTFG